LEKPSWHSSCGLCFFDGYPLPRNPLQSKRPTAAAWQLQDEMQARIYFASGKPLIVLPGLIFFCLNHP
jgi:hypothetical protein